MKITGILVHEIHAKSLTFIESLCRERASLAIEIRACERILEQEGHSKNKNFTYMIVNNSTHKYTQLYTE